MSREDAEEILSLWNAGYPVTPNEIGLAVTILSAEWSAGNVGGGE